VYSSIVHANVIIYHILYDTSLFNKYILI